MAAHPVSLAALAGAHPPELAAEGGAPLAPAEPPEVPRPSRPLPERARVVVVGAPIPWIPVDIPARIALS